MSSKGLIVAKYRDGYYRAIVCERGMDVFPGGICLLRKYNGLPEIDKLFEKSHLDTLGATLDECHLHHEAMGAPHLPSIEFTSADQIFEHPYVVGVLYPGVDYIYLFEDGEWCVSWRMMCANGRKKRGDNKNYRIIIAGYDGEHDELLNYGWTVESWKANGGYANQGNGKGKENAKRERLWLSPHCLKERDLFEQW